MRPHLQTLDALRAVADGRKIPSCKYGALKAASLIRVRGHGRERRPELTEAGREALAQAEARA